MYVTAHFWSDLIALYVVYYSLNKPLYVSCALEWDPGSGNYTCLLSLLRTTDLEPVATEWYITRAITDLFTSHMSIKGKFCVTFTILQKRTLQEFGHSSSLKDLMPKCKWKHLMPYILKNTRKILIKYLHSFIGVCVNPLWDSSLDRVVRDSHDYFPLFTC